MPDLEDARQIAMSLPNTVEQGHFGIPSFRVNNRIFSTLWIHDNKMMVKLPLIEQSIFSAIDSHAIYPVPNKYGGMGCTLFELSKVSPELLADALNIAYHAIIDKTKKKRKQR